MSIYEASITNPKKQLEFYKDLSEQLQQESQKYKEVINKTNNYIKQHSNNGVEYLDIWEIEELLEILKGSGVDE